MASAPRVVGTLAHHRPPLVDPRDGDIETDASSTESQSLLALAGNLLAEVSLPKMAAAFLLLVVVPAVLLGLAPVAVTIWARTLSYKSAANGLWAVLVLAALVALAWFGGRPLFRLAESSFWSLNAMAIQPGYAAWREGFLHLAERVAGAKASETRRARLRTAAGVLAGFVICALSLVVVWLVWPFTHWIGTLRDLRAPHWLALTAVANATVVAAAYLATAGLVWGLADAAMPQPYELTGFRSRRDLVRSWRVAHLSDLHVVGERYGFRLGSGRAGPRGNEALLVALRRLDELHRREPLDAIVITGDLTDAGTPAEWAELLDALDAFPRLTPLIVALPGNHDMNVVDRANPARLDLPTSPKKRLRELRTISALAAIQGARARVVTGERDNVGDTVDRMLAPNAASMRAFADRGTRRLSKQAHAAWNAMFPMVLPPATEDGLGIVALNSNAETHFSFTNALGLVTAEEAHAADAVMNAYPRATWIVALHHHVVEHPKLGDTLAKRIGTTLINGNWFTRQLQRVASRAVVMHGHRHIDWMGQCGDLLILSAPSTTMPATTESDVYFYVHTVGVDARGHVALAEPERVICGTLVAPPVPIRSGAADEREP
jgi:predicted MPP superfamily phosphohydrolase